MSRASNHWSAMALAFERVAGPTERAARRCGLTCDRCGDAPAVRDATHRAEHLISILCPAPEWNGIAISLEVEQLAVNGV